MLTRSVIVASALIVVTGCADGAQDDSNEDTSSSSSGGMSQGGAGTGGSGNGSASGGGAAGGSGSGGEPCTSFPGAPSAPVPADGATDVDFNTVTSVAWGAGSDAVGYDVFLGDACPPPTHPDSAFVPVSTPDLSGLALSGSTDYCWQVASVDAEGCATLGPAWSFTTTTCVDASPGDPVVTSDHAAFAPGSSVYQLTFDEDVQDVAANLTWTAATGTGTLDSVTAVNGSTYDVAFSGTADGDQYVLTLDPPIRDSCGNQLATTIRTITISDSNCALTEDFSSSTFPPTGWALEDGGTLGNSWYWCDTVTCNQFAFEQTSFTIATGTFAVVDSGPSPGLTFDEGLVSPELSCTGVSSVQLSFVHRYLQYMGDVAEVQVSTNGGSSWTTAQTFISTGSAGAPATVDLSALAAGQPSVKVRFHYTADWDWHWMIDTIAITSSP